MGEPIGGHDDRRAAQPQELDQQQAERSAAVDARPGADARSVPDRARGARHRAARAGRPRRRRCESGTRWSRWLGQGMTERSAPSVVPKPANRVAMQMLVRPRRHGSHWPHGSAGSAATRSPARGPSRITPPNSWPSTSGRTRPASPIPARRYQCRSEPHRPTAVTRTRTSPGPGVGSRLAGEPDVARPMQPRDLGGAGGLQRRVTAAARSRPSRRACGGSGGRAATSCHRLGVRVEGQRLDGHRRDGLERDRVVGGRPRIRDPR